MLIDLAADALILQNGAIISLRNFINKFSFVVMQMRTFKICLFFFLIAFTACSFYLFISKKSLFQIQYNLSTQEKNDLRLFFQDLFVDNELGYTLFGDKPMSFCFPVTHAPYFSKKDCRIWIYHEGTLPLFRGLAVWKKICSKIKKENYLFIICEEKQYPNFVILINKKAFAKTFRKNIDLFKKYYGEKVTITELLNNLENNKNYNEISQTPLFYNDILLGIMLGYGRHNAELFQRRKELTESQFSLLPISPSKEFPSIEEEVKYLWEHLQVTRNTHDWLLRVIGVGFAADPDDLETQMLIKKYDLLHKELISIFDRQDWLEVILNKLIK